MTHRGMVRQANIGLLWALALIYSVLAIRAAPLGQDAHAYWLALQGGPLYDGRPRELDAYLYSPAFAQALSPLGWLPWGAFCAAWFALGVWAVVWLARPLPLRWAVPAAAVAVPDVIIGNIYVFLAVMVALGVRHPAAWAFGVLTKVTPGVGIVWLLARRDFRGAAIACGVTFAIVAASWSIAPGDWAGWMGLLTSGDGGDPTFVPRCLVAIVLAAMAARPGRVWLLAVAVVMATPVFTATACVVPLIAIPRLLQVSRSDEAPANPIARLEGAGRRVVARSAAR